MKTQGEHEVWNMSCKWNKEFGKWTVWLSNSVDDIDIMH